MLKLSNLKAIEMLLVLSLTSLVASCASETPVWLRTQEGSYIRETPVGSLDLKSSPARFEPKNGSPDSRSQADLLIDIVDDVQLSEIYKQHRSSIAKLIVGERPNEVWYVLKNNDYFVIMPADDHDYNDQLLETKRGKFVVKDSGVMVHTR